MTEPRGAKADTAGTTEDIERMRARIKELEAQLQARPADGSGDHQVSRGQELERVLILGLAATTVVMAPPAFITLRRWYRWWWD